MKHLLLVHWKQRSFKRQCPVRPYEQVNHLFRPLSVIIASKFAGLCRISASDPTSIRATTTLAPTTTTRPEPETCDDFHNEGDKGTISSPHYPGYYGYEITCQYFLQVSKNKVRLQFDSVNIDLPLTSLKVSIQFEKHILLYRPW